MATVPTYDNLRATQGAPSPSLFQVPGGPSAAEVGAKQVQDAGTAVQRGSDALSKVMLDAAEQANQARVNDAMNQAMAARLTLTHDKEQGFGVLQGRAALERPDGQALPDEFGGKLDQQLAKIRDSLGNDAQKRAFGLQSGQLATQFRGQVQQHMAVEGKRYELSVQAGTAKVAADQIALEWQNADAVAQGIGAIKAATAKAGELQGLSPAETLAKTVDTLSPVHRSVVAQALQSGWVDYAKAYMQKVNAELTPTDRMQLQEAVKVGDVAVQATRTADTIWGTKGPGQDRNAPVDLFAMETAAREAFPNDPAKAKATIGELRERAQAFNASQTEYHAANTTAVYRMLDSGMGMNAVRRSPAWLALPGDQQHRVTLAIEQEAAARESRAAAAEGREFTRMQREERMLLLNNGAAYMRYGDPEVLGSMTRTQVEALRPVFGQEGTMHLLAKYDGLQKADGKLTATIDKQDFDQLADQMGLKPYAKDNSEDHKRTLGTLQYRVEQLIDQAQRVKKAPLDRAEKAELMRQEIARRVAVPGWFSDSSVPVIQLSPQQAASVRVPDADRQQIVQALRTMAQREPNNPAYAPTDANVRRLYLRRQSPAAGLIPPPGN